VLGGWRAGISGAVLLAKRLLSARPEDRAALLTTAPAQRPAPIEGVISDAPQSMRQATAQALPGVPPQRGPFHYLREAARPIDEADRHAKKELKKRARGARGIERQREARDDPEAQAIRGYGSAGRGAVTDDGRPPLDASGLKLQERLAAMATSLGPGEGPRGSRANSGG